MPKLSQIHIYPVKSLAGIQVEQWPVDKTGLRYDRKWMLVGRNGEFLSQRRLPKMALIKTHAADTRLILSAPGQDDIALPLESHAGEDIEVGIWQDRCLAKTVGNGIDSWLSSFLQSECRLVYHPNDRIRQVDPNYALASDQTAFSDGFPFLLVSEASLQAFNRAAQLDLAMVRFRPNLVVSECESYAEDGWRKISINNIGFRLPKPCSRCTVPAIDPETAVSDNQTIPALARLRRWQNKVYFGQNALHDEIGVLSVGAHVEIIESGPMRPPL